MWVTCAGGEKLFEISPQLESWALTAEGFCEAIPQNAGFCARVHKISYFAVWQMAGWGTYRKKV